MRGEGLRSVRARGGGDEEKQEEKQEEKERKGRELGGREKEGRDVWRVRVGRELSRR